LKEKFSRFHGLINLKNYCSERVKILKGFCACRHASNLRNEKKQKTIWQKTCKHTATRHFSALRNGSRDRRIV